MKGVILAGGLGTRLYPLTHVTNKHLLPIYNQPMIFYPINTLVKSGVDEILIVVGGPYCGHFLSVLKNGKELGVKHLEFAYQENEGGIADALSLAEAFSEGDSIAAILGDNTTDADISSDINNFQKGAKIFIREVPDPQRFGVPTFDPNDSSRIMRITEKPQNPDTNFAVTGLYLYDNKVFEYIKKIQPSERGELEITDVNNFYAQSGNLSWSKLEGFWRDAGTFDTLLEANNFWAGRSK